MIRNNETITLNDITRVEVIDNKGRSYVSWEDGNVVKLSIQDNGKTMKIFIIPKHKNIGN